MTRIRLSTLAATAALAAAGGLITAAPASAAVTCTSPAWTAQYFANTSFSGTPKLTACDSAIAENMGSGDPAGVTLPNDNFSIRWSLTRDFGSGGPFRISAATQDGMRVYVDGVRKIDLWKNVSATARKTLDLSLPAGRHTIRVDYVAWTGSAYAGFTYAARTQASVDTVKPLNPTGLTAAYNRDTAKTALRWSVNKEMDLAGYRVYRRLSTTQWANVGGTSLLTSPSFVDAPPATGQTFLYEVRAVDKAGRESTGSPDVTATTVDRTGPAAPTGITVQGDSYINTLRWQDVADADRYEVHAADTATGPFTLLGSTSGAMYEDRTAPVNRYRYYQVRAIDVAGNAGAFSDTAAGDGVDRTPPEAPTHITSGVGPEGNHIYWNMPGEFFQDHDNGGHFRVYRSPGATLDRTQLTRVTCTYYNVQGSDPMEGHCTDTGMAQGAYYTYAVTAVDAAGNESELSGPVTVRTADRVAPAPVTGVKATPRKDGVLVSWAASNEDDIERYTVWTGVRVDDDTVTWVSSQCREGQSDPLAVLCGDLPDGETYVYAVVAKDRWGNVLQPGAAGVTHVDATELEVRPSVPVHSDWPFGLVSHDTVTSGGYGPTANWRCENTYLCPSVTGYRANRWNPATEAYEPLPGGLLPVETRSYADSTATRGNTYFYTLEAVRADGSVAGVYPWYTVVQDRV
ncbi:PA14 domain-containing protein [Streptomyces sp. SP18CS02]|uniref:PA14 domain-containing protein n=1 Tax=Streptomyces sp. SP18CS02 TaxID=3002531 RepID=UPI002E7831A9|nr:PA14 domain-containing protein [Streptomyces sp. SP18CS02]MEE1753066.1 PA14 domain-containing protein [Streptomyces sp. SP18CS02]